MNHAMLTIQGLIISNSNKVLDINSCIDIIKTT